jgi:chromosome segregation ATPase
MRDLQQHISSIRGNIDRLLRLYQAMRQENKLLKTQVDTLRSQVAEKNQTIEQLKAEMDVIKTAHAIRGNELDENSLSEEQKEVRKKINEYIREIDACIKKLEA